MNDLAQPDGTVGSEHLGVRVFCITAPNAQQLADQIAVVLGERLTDDDELQLTYSAIPSGWCHDPGRTGWRVRRAHTQLFAEYTALLVLRPTRSSEPGV